MDEVIILINVKSLSVTRSLGSFPISVFSRLKDTLPSISNIFTKKFAGLFSKVHFGETTKSMFV